jgi:hypothetical protein
MWHERLAHLPGRHRIRRLTPGGVTAPKVKRTDTMYDAGRLAAHERQVKAMRAFERLSLGLAALAEPDDVDGVDRRQDIPRIAELRGVAEENLSHAAALLPDDPAAAASVLGAALRRCIDAWLLQWQIVLDSEGGALPALERHAPLLALRVQWALGRQDPRDQVRQCAAVYRVVFGREPLNANPVDKHLASRQAHGASRRIAHDGGGSLRQPLPLELLR